MAVDRIRPKVSLTLSEGALYIADEIAKRHERTRSYIVEFLIREEGRRMRIQIPARFRK